MDAEFLFIPLRWLAKSATFAGYFLPLRSDGVFFYEGLGHLGSRSRCPRATMQRSHSNIPRVIQRPAATHTLHRMIIAESKSARRGYIMPEGFRPFEDPITLPDSRT
jgi:hypothetical protein